MTLEPINDKTLRQGIATLRRRDRDLAGVIERFGVPPLWNRSPGFATLVHIVLEQQVSLASAKAAYDRLFEYLDVIDADAFLTLDAETLRACGFSRQKSRYCRGIAAAVSGGSFDLDGLAGQSDEEARRRLLAIPGIGPWTANIYLLMALGRRDIWPVGDLALAVAAQRIKRLPERPDAAELETIGEAWRPWRSVAARLLWQSYLNEPDRKRD